MTLSFERCVWCFRGLLFAALCLPVQAQSVPGASFPVNVLVESPALTKTDLQTICLFQADAANTLHGSLAEIDEKLGGLLSRIRKDNLFSGNLGETLLIQPKPGTIPARRLLLIGLGDLQGFSPAREQVVGFIFFEHPRRPYPGIPESRATLTAIPSSCIIRSNDSALETGELVPSSG